MELLRVADMYTCTPLNRYCEEVCPNVPHYCLFLLVGRSTADILRLLLMLQVLMENLSAANAVGFLIITDERRKGLG